MSDSYRYTRCSIATMVRGAAPYGWIPDADCIVEQGRIAWVGPAEDLPTRYRELEPRDLGGRLVTPCLIDCHTHLIFGGNRAQEFELRLEGMSYADIAQRGGGIRSTVRATRAASDQELTEQALMRLDDLIAEGVGVVEIKSGYGLTIEHELRLLRIARALQRLRPVQILTTWLAAHALPDQFSGRPEEFLDSVVIPGLEHAHREGLVDAVDGYCEHLAFSRDQVSRVFTKARALGLPVKLHAEQLSDQKGATLVAQFGGLSADHLEYLDPRDVPEFAASGAVAVLLPGAYYTLGETQAPPLAALREHGVEMAVATDCNPGTSPLSSILTAMNLGCIQWRMTAEEALVGVTRAAAAALGLQREVGAIFPGARAELAVWNVEHPAELAYWVGGSPLFRRISQMVTV